MLRDYQIHAVNETREAFKTHQRVVLQMPTGAGKTHTAAEIIKLAVARGKRVLFCAHLDSLLESTQKRLGDCGRYQAGYDVTDHPIQVASLQTLWARKRGPPADLVIFDECHRAIASTYYEMITSWYPDAKILGLTATPVRGDGAGLKNLFTHMVVGPKISDLQAEGLLVQGQLYASEDPVELVYKQHFTDRHTVIFTDSVAHAHYLADTLGGEAVDGDSPTREVLGRFERGENKLLVNCQLLVEGWDAPIADGLIINRTCGHVGVWIQIVGRVMRPHPGKQFAKICDLRGAYKQFGLPWDDHDWCLGDDPIKTKPLPIQRCKQCFACYPPAPKCPRCGYVQPMEVPTFHEPEDGPAKINLIEKYQVDSEEKKLAYFEKLSALARLKNYKSGWVGFKFKSKYGHWPKYGGFR